MSKKRKKLTEKQKNDLALCLSWYNFARAMHKKQEEQIKKDLYRMIEDVILNEGEE